MLDIFQRLGTSCPNSEKLYHPWQENAISDLQGFVQILHGYKECGELVSPGNHPASSANRFPETEASGTLWLFQPCSQYPAVV
jgi:hypothetical protein